MAEGQGTITSGNQSNFDWSAAAVVGAQAGGNILTNWLNRREARKAREWQEAMWHKQNEYNLPVNQVSRLKEAGINPNLAFGSAASAMGTSVPSSPARANYDFVSGAAQNWFRNKLERASVLAQVRERNAAIRRTELENSFMEAVLNDKIAATLWGYRSDAAKGKWFSVNNDEWFGSQLTGQQFKNDLAKAEKAYKVALEKRTKQATRLAIQEYNHLVNKYGFEDSFYSRGLNPYETSTWAGLARSIAGLGGHVLGDPGAVAQDLHLLWDPVRDGVMTLYNMTKRFAKYEKNKYYR